MGTAQLLNKLNFISRNLTRSRHTYWSACLEPDILLTCRSLQELYSDGCLGPDAAVVLGAVSLARGESLKRKVRGVQLGTFCWDAST